MSPNHHHHHHLRIPSILEQAIKAEPKVEVERINSPSVSMTSMIEENVSSRNITSSPPSAASSVTIRTTYPNNNHQRPNLETIVEAIRHLEGDAFDMDEETGTAIATTPESLKHQQEAPLALTTSSSSSSSRQQINGFVVKEPFKFRQSATSQSGLPQFVSVPLQQKHQPQYQQQRPGVIVVKQSSWLTHCEHPTAEKIT